MNMTLSDTPNEYGDCLVASVVNRSSALMNTINLRLFLWSYLKLSYLTLLRFATFLLSYRSDYNETEDRISSILYWGSVRHNPAQNVLLKIDRVERPELGIVASSASHYAVPASYLKYTRYEDDTTTSKTRWTHLISPQLQHVRMWIFAV